MKPSSRKRIAVFICYELLTFAFQMAACFVLYKVSSDWMVGQQLKFGGAVLAQTALAMLLWLSVSSLRCESAPLSHRW